MELNNAHGYIYWIPFYLNRDIHLNNTVIDRTKTIQCTILIADKSHKYTALTNVSGLWICFIFQIPLVDLYTLNRKWKKNLTFTKYTELRTLNGSPWCILETRVRTIRTAFVYFVFTHRVDPFSIKTEFSAWRRLKYYNQDSSQFLCEILT